MSKVYSGVDQLPSGRASDVVVPGCICLEGGAFRGVYGEGVLDAFMEAELNFQTVIGVSAGALNGLNYVAGQIGRSARTNLRYRHDGHYVGMAALHNSHSIVNLDFLFHDIAETDPLDEERFFRPDRRFIAVAANCLTGEAMYYEKGVCGDIFAALKASASMPYISPMVDVDGTPCLDGGCACKIPYQWALDQGFEKIVVIRTQARSYRKHEKHSRTAGRIYHDYPAFAEKLARSSIDYNHQCDELLRLEQEGRIFMLAPSEPVTVSRVEPDMEKLGELYYMGYADAKREIPRLRAYLEEN